MESFEQSLQAVGMLADDLRRRMYLFIRNRRRPVGRDEAAQAVGISRKLAAFHLDKLVQKGLLRAHYVRLSGRVGPGAGRPSKVYEPTDAEMNVSIPSRSYDFAGRLLVKALERSGTEGSPREAVQKTAYEEGIQVGSEVRHEQGLRSPGSKKTAELAQHLLYDRGYEPYRDEDGSVRLRNCPFHALAQESVELVCGMNQAFITGVLEGLGNRSMTAKLGPLPGQCCVRISSEKTVA